MSDESSLEQFATDSDKGILGKSGRYYPTWREIAESSIFTGLDEKARTEVRDTWFEEVVAPRVSPDQLNAVRTEIEEKTLLTLRTPEPWRLFQAGGQVSSAPDVGLLARGALSLNAPGGYGLDAAGEGSYRFERTSDSVNPVTDAELTEARLRTPAGMAAITNEPQRYGFQRNVGRGLLSAGLDVGDQSVDVVGPFGHMPLADSPEITGAGVSWERGDTRLNAGVRRVDNEPFWYAGLRTKW